MELFSAAFFSALLAVIIINLVLSGDNAIVIGMAARNLPKEQQKKVILWGTLGAIVVRALATVAVVWLLLIPGLMLIGGLLLIWIAYKLLTDDNKHDVKAAHSVMAAVQTVIIADAVMGIDNVLAIAGAAHGSYLLVVLGLLFSVPIVIWGSTLFIKLLNRYPAIIYIGASVLAWTAAKMIAGEKLLKDYFANPFLEWGLVIGIVTGVLLAGKVKQSKQSKQKQVVSS
ncbi:TerC family protein [Effusibacillus lacus]|uniref:Membrane protein n=1 Tax=Effusibacillus lacus TaxID=1348429 RepID=A0A292YQM0_9BACL|nr:TerC family protein [Effusibacillus lacus]TCS76876.1 YjbE family integral membrane protein [Effusibacillus lacus]GAX91209.1 membrane protein [Effusibacillus lacus]